MTDSKEARLHPDFYPVKVAQDVRWGEMDAFNHVNNTVYFKYFETARIRFMEESGMLDLMEREKVGPILGHIEASFRIPLTYPDRLILCARVQSVGNSSLVVGHMVWSEQHGKPACYGDGVVVMLDYKTQRKVTIPDAWRKILENYR